MATTPKQGRYETVAELGRGGAARVWAGRLPGLKKPFAFKYLREDLTDDQFYRQRFEREAEIGLAISGDHPNIVTVRGYDPDAAGAPLLVLDLVGPPVAALKDQLVGDWCAIRWIAVEALRALIHIERCRVVHRDISPGNLLVAPNGRVRLNDFGNATRYDGAFGARVIGGTIPYVSPELLGGARGTPASDMFSLGAVLYELATGEPPFGTTMAQVVRNQGAAVLALPRPVPRDLRHVILGQLAIEQGRRRHATDALADLMARVDTAAATARLGPLSQKSLSERCPTLVGELAAEALHHTPELAAWEPERRTRSRRFVPALAAAVSAAVCMAAWFAVEAQWAGPTNRDSVEVWAERDDNSPRPTPRYLETDVLPSVPPDTPVSPADQGEPDGPREALREDEAQGPDAPPAEPMVNHAARRDESRPCIEQRSDGSVDSAEALSCALERYSGRINAYALQGDHWMVLYDGKRNGTTVDLKVLTGGTFIPRRAGSVGERLEFGTLSNVGDGWLARLPKVNVRSFDVLLWDDRGGSFKFAGVRL